MYWVITLLVAFDLLTGVHSQTVVQLIRHTLPDGLQSVNGSDHIGGCSRPAAQGRFCAELDEGGTSDLTDCVIPSLGGFQGNWTAGLFTVNRSGQSSFYIGFEFNSSVHFTRVELDLFNCPEWGIAVKTITVYEYAFETLDFIAAVARALGNTTASAKSCNSIVRVVIPLEFPHNPTITYIIDFTFVKTATHLQWVHIAEVRFLEEEDTQCPTPSSTSVIPTHIQHILSQETTFPHDTMQPIQSHETVRSTLPHETGQPILPHETVQQTPGTAPHPDNSFEQIIVPVIITAVVILLLIMIAVIIPAVIFIRRWRKKQQSEIQSIIMENENIELKEENVQLDNPHYDDAHAYIKPAGQGKNKLEVNREETIAENLRTLEDSQQRLVSGDVRETNVTNTQHRNIPEVKEGIRPGCSEGLDTIQPLYSAVQKTRPQIPQKSSELYADLKAEKEANTDLPVYAAVVKKEPPTVPSKSEELTEFLESQKQPNNLTSKYDHLPTREVQAIGQCSHPAKPPRLVALSNPIFEGMEPDLVYRSIDDLINVPQESISDDIYTVPNTTGPQTTNKDHRMLEVVYSEPIKPSLFTDAVKSPNGSKLSEDLQPYSPIYTVPVAPLQSKIMPVEVSTGNIREIHDLGTGHFGQVVLAETVGLSLKDLRLSESDDDKSKSNFVAVKKLKPNAPKNMKENFEKEVEFMSRLDNSNVIRMLGVCYEDTPFIMLEYMEKGDLNQYLKKFNVVTSIDSELQCKDQITTGILVHMTAQIASAMKYLASRNFVHRDLATRNCLVGQNYLVKIADFGMSRILYESHYYIIHGHAALPVRWMSTECFYGKFSQKSDVWAFGVTMWEIFTLAKGQPYTGVSDQDVIKDAIKGKSRKLLAKPAACPPEVYEIMLACWAHKPTQRATFEELFRVLSSMVTD